MPKRLAITISGAVSLGSYEAGVLFEIITALTAHNNSTIADHQKIQIDVITGASAGGMTAAIAAQYLLVGANQNFKEDDNPFYLPWIKWVDIENLLQEQPSDDPTKSILSSSTIDEISRRSFLSRYETGLPPTSKIHSLCNGKIYLGLALSNLNGIDYGISLTTGGDFIYTRFEDQFVRKIDALTCDNIAYWTPIGKAAVATGSFPFAFKIRELQRDHSEYLNSVWTGLEIAPTSFPNTNFRFAYTDGGVFHNEPLSLAKRLVNEIDNHQNEDSRFYLFVSPGGRASGVDHDFSASKATLYVTAMRILNAIFEQSRFHELEKIERVNESIRNFQRLTNSLAAHMSERPEEAKSIASVFDAFVNEAYSNEGTIAMHKERIETQFDDNFASFDANPNLDASFTDAFSSTILALETLSNLQDKEEMLVYGIQAGPSELAGHKIFAFQGFLEERLRQHDYQLGRMKVREFIAKLNADVGNGRSNAALGPINYNPIDGISLDNTLNDADIKITPDRIRRRVGRRLLDRADGVLEEFGLNALVRAGVEKFMIEPRIEDLLETDL